MLTPPYSQENAILLNPIFSNRAHKLWVQLKALLGGGEMTAACHVTRRCSNPRVLS